MVSVINICYVICVIILISVVQVYMYKRHNYEFQKNSKNNRNVRVLLLIIIVLVSGLVAAFSQNDVSFGFQRESVASYFFDAQINKSEADGAWQFLKTLSYDYALPNWLIVMIVVHFTSDDDILQGVSKADYLAKMSWFQAYKGNPKTRKNQPNSPTSEFVYDSRSTDQFISNVGSNQKESLESDKSEGVVIN